MTTYYLKIGDNYVALDTGNKLLLINGEWYKVYGYKNGSISWRRLSWPMQPVLLVGMTSGEVMLDKRFDKMVYIKKGFKYVSLEKYRLAEFE